MDIIKLGDLRIYPFGLFMAPLIFVALLITSRSMSKARLSRNTASWFAFLSIPLCFVFARVGYCLFVIDQIIGDNDFLFVFRLNEGGFLLWGAILGGITAACLTSRITHQPAWKIMDSAAVSACLLIAAGRLICGFFMKNQGIGFAISDWFNTEWMDPEEADYANRFSLLVIEDYSFFERLPFAVQNSYGTYCWAIFIPEALWSVITAIKVSRSKRLLGRKTMLFIVMYASGQIVLESMLRGEVLHLPWLGFVKANQILCAIAIVIVIIICIGQLDYKDRFKNALVSIAMLVPAISLIVVMEFAVFEKKISLIQHWPSDVCHLIMAIGCVWLYITASRLFKRYPKYSEKTFQNILT